MKQNGNKSFKVASEPEKLMKGALDKLNAELEVKLRLSDLYRLGIKSFCMQIKSGQLSSKEILFSKV